jgi:hypothetical protein
MKPFAQASGLSRQVILRRCVGSRNRLLASLALGGQRSFPLVAGVDGAGFAAVAGWCPWGNILAAWASR